MIQMGFMASGRRRSFLLFMKNTRRKRRFENRQNKRKKNFPTEADDFEKVFSHDHLFDACRKCRRSVGWKPEVQRFTMLAPLEIDRIYKSLHSGNFRSKGFREFDIFERGKPRHIKALPFDERIIQRCLCDYSLAPMLTRSFIYDNGACMKDKGYSFAQKRCTQHLVEYVRRNGTEGYVLIFDFRKYFDTIRHDTLEGLIRKTYTDEMLINLILYMISTNGPQGLGLGSQISQVLALAYASPLDHMIKEQLGIRYYARYNDDGYLIHPSKKCLQHCLREIERVCTDLGIVLNPKKVMITKITKGFNFLKCRYFVTKTGKIVRKPCRKAVTRQRRRIKKLFKKVEEGKLSLNDVQQSYLSHRAYLKGFTAYRTRQAEDRLFKSLWREYASQIKK